MLDLLRLNRKFAIRSSSTEHHGLILESRDAFPNQVMAEFLIAETVPCYQPGTKGKEVREYA